MMECLCEYLHNVMSSQMTVSNSLGALKNSNSMTGCNILTCNPDLESLSVPSSVSIPVEMILVSMFIAVFYLFNPKSEFSSKINV